MKPEIHPSLIFRTPKFSYQASLAESWDELKAAIAISSSTFYETIKDVQTEDLNQLSPKVFFTIWKYFNRAKYRSTPYGTFAGFSLLNDAIKSGNSEIVIDQKQLVHHFIDWPYRNELQLDFLQSVGKNPTLFSNTSYYLTHDSIRYIACTDGIFELAEIENNEFVKEVLEACTQPIRLNDLLKKLGVEENGKHDFVELLTDLHSLQLIFNHDDPNIIGEDYFERIGIQNDNNKPQYLIAERKVLQGTLDEKLLKSLPGLVELLAKIIPANKREALDRFTTRFQQKFDQQEVPLLVALDPEMGVGYDELEQAGEDDFVGQFNLKKQQTKNKTSIKSVLESHLSTEAFKNDTIYLNKLPLDFAPNENTIPNSLSVLMSVADDLICIDQIGGVTANALTGRFTMANDAVESYCKAISKREQDANPEVLFFDVAYMVETNVDNINRRKLVYDHQLSILNFDTSSNPLSIADIQISVRNNQLILRSASLNKRLVPRMASAYNYTRSDLSLFRILCDLQHQGIQTNLSFSLENLFPDLDFYPRFQYHNVILNTAKWRVNKSDFSDSLSNLSTEKCQEILKNKGVSRFFKTGNSDQTLCFDTYDKEDMYAFLQWMQKQTSIYLEEVIFPAESILKDETQQPYLGQFILNLYHNQAIYPKIGAKQNVDDGVKRTFLPGQEWLYFEIFCHQQRADEILTGLISSYLNQFSQHIQSWFFIRYNENGNHLRFRVLLIDDIDAQKLIAALMDSLTVYVTAGMVADVQIKTYSREIERYGADLIVQVEQHFAVDSDYVLSLLNMQTDAFSKYKSCWLLINELQNAGIFDFPALLLLIKSVSDLFNKEHHLDASDFKKLNQQYQDYRLTPAFNLDDQTDFDAFAKSFIYILQQTNGSRRAKLFTDLMHMHINRLFNKDQRSHEMVMYYFLLKDMQRKKAMN